MTDAGEALGLLLNLAQRTGDRASDMVRALRLHAEVRELERALILQALYAKLGSWKKVAKAVGRPQTTVWSWAHPRREV